MSKARTYLHPIDALRRLGRMPARKEGESDKAFGNRIAKRASDVAEELGLTRYQSGARSLQFCEAQVDRAAKQHVTAIAA